MRFPRLLLPLIALGFLAAASKPALTIRFHTEASDKTGGGSQFTMSSSLPDSSQSICLSKVAEISEKEVVAIFPFPADNGTWGCALKLDNHGRIALDTLSQEYHGTVLVGFVNGRAVTAMLIDRRVADGIITIPSGLTPGEIAQMQKVFPTLGAPKGKKAGAVPAGRSISARSTCIRLYGLSCVSAAASLASTTS